MADGIRYIGSSRAIQDIKEKLTTVAACDASVLITGETGTGKEVLAKNIHEFSLRSRMPFIALNCGGMPRELVENELFGHKRGAYSQAFENSKGLVEEARGGTLFLDEIDSLPMDNQPKLLRFLQEKEYRILGDSRLKKVDLRFMSASNLDLEERVKEGAFRSDLFYRLSIFHIHLPPLRERTEDIPRLAEHFLKKYGKIYGKQHLEISREAIVQLVKQDWMGNIRELENALHRAVVSCAGPELQPRHLDLPKIESNEEHLDWTQPYHHLKRKIIDSFESQYVGKLLREHRGNVSSAARSAHLDRRTFQRLMAKHKLRK